MSVTHAEFTIERRYPTTPAQTFSAFSQPELRRRWFANPGGWDNAEWSLDFRVGGFEISRGGRPDGPFNDFLGRFHEIVPDQRIIFDYDLRKDEQLISVSLTTVELHPDGAGTRLTFTEQGAFLSGGDPAAAEREHGTGLLLDKLGTILDAEFTP